jgi:hypothetical protein
VYIVQSADREIRLLFPEYFNEGLSVQRSMEDMEDDHRLVGDEWKNANFFIYFIYLETQFKLIKAKLADALVLLQPTEGECLHYFLL